MHHWCLSHLPILVSGLTSAGWDFQRNKCYPRKPYSIKVLAGHPKDMNVWEVGTSQLPAKLPQIPMVSFSFPSPSPVSDVLVPPLLLSSVPLVAWPCWHYNMRTLNLTSSLCPPLHVHLEPLSNLVLSCYYLSSLGGRRGGMEMPMVIVSC